MVELQQNLDSFEKSGIWVCAISYDPVDVLGEFAQKHAITYPLLADTDSEVMRLFGIMNTNIPEDHPWYGIPFPGTIMADEWGAVIDRSFYANHVVRDAAARMLQDVFQVEDARRGLVQSVETDSLKATAYLSSGTIRPGQVLSFTCEIEVKEGRHLHARPGPEAYMPTTLTLQEIEDVQYGEVTYPAPKPHRLAVLDETLPVHDGRIVLKATVRSSRKEGFLVQARLESQACDERQCYLPEQVDFELPIDFLENVQD